MLLPVCQTHVLMIKTKDRVCSSSCEVLITKTYGHWARIGVLYVIALIARYVTALITQRQKEKTTHTYTHTHTHKPKEKSPGFSATDRIFNPEVFFGGGVQSENQCSFFDTHKFSLQSDPFLYVFFCTVFFFSIEASLSSDF